MLQPGPGGTLEVPGGVSGPLHLSTLQLLKLLPCAFQISQPLTPLVDEFAGRLFGELDYVQEGQNCERFAELYGHVPRVRTPGGACHAFATAIHGTGMSMFPASLC